ncbi:MAG: hypothetical protein AAF725_24255, partial [Acidobacteriota bacterium]
MSSRGPERSDVLLEIPEESARLTVLARALDEVDAAGDLLPLEERLEITRDAAAGASGRGIEASWLPERAKLVVDALLERRPGLRPSAAAWSLGPAAAGVLALAFALGAGANALGPERGISIVAPPLLGLILWNVGVFALRAGREERK